VQGVRAVTLHKPDIVILDLDMPVMDGLTALPEILRARPGVSVLIASTLTARSARLSMQCLALGAVDLVPKPQTGRDLTLSTAFRDELMRKISALPVATGAARDLEPAHRAEAARVSAAPKGARRAMAGLPERVRPPPRALLIGASTGGPRAVMTVLEALGERLALLPVFIVQHMPPVFTASFAEQLAQRLGRPAREAVDGEIVAPGQIVVAPGGQHLRLALHDNQVRTVLDHGPPIRFCRPSVDVLFSDAAEIYGAQATAVILTGMGSDGCDGARLLHKAGATIIAQDEATSVVWGMPGAVAKAGVAHHITPLPGIAPLIRETLRREVQA
jgi:two-component system chemotaxis response regulator CheB